ncbi:beta-hydroxylase [Burkholderia multivorans]
MRSALLLVFVACVVYSHRRGRVRHDFIRQLSDHSTFTAPLNCFSYAFSMVPTTSFVPTTHFPELDVLQREWKTFRDEALGLRDARRIVVDGESCAWHDGEAVIFDGTCLHWAENRTDRDRIILFCDIDWPMRFRRAQWINDAFGMLLMRAAASPNEAGDRTGGLNRAFKYLYAICRVGKRLKAWNRTVYYIVKLALFGGIAVAIFWQ